MLFYGLMSKAIFYSTGTYPVVGGVGAVDLVDLVLGGDGVPSPGLAPGQPGARGHSTWFQYACSVTFV